MAHPLTARDNVALAPGMKQIAVLEAWDEDDPAAFEVWFREQFGVRVQFLEVIETPHRLQSGNLRCDLLFAIFEADRPRLIEQRTAAFAAGDEEAVPGQLRWLEDVLVPFNYRAGTYPARVFGYVTAWPEIAPGMEFVAAPQESPGAGEDASTETSARKPPH